MEIMGLLTCYCLVFFLERNTADIASASSLSRFTLVRLVVQLDVRCRATAESAEMCVSLMDFDANGCSIVYTSSVQRSDLSFRNGDDSVLFGRMDVNIIIYEYIILYEYSTSIYFPMMYTSTEFCITKSRSRNLFDWENMWAPCETVEGGVFLGGLLLRNEESRTKELIILLSTSFRFESFQAFQYF